MIKNSRTEVIGDEIRIPIIATISSGATTLVQLRATPSSVEYIPLVIDGTDILITTEQTNLLAEGTYYVELEQTLDTVVTTLQRTQLTVIRDVARESGIPISSSLELTNAVLDSLDVDTLDFTNATGSTLIVDDLTVSNFEITNFLNQINTGVDTGIEVIEQFSVGTPSAGKESIFGQGHAYGVGLEDDGVNGVPHPGSAWHFDYADMTGNIIVNATDITDLISTYLSGSTSFFGGTTSGKTILVGSEYTYGGAKVLLDAVGVIEPDNVQAEYLYGGTTWIPVNYMATSGEQPYTRFGNNLATTLSEQWRFELDPEFLPTPWIKTTLNINGTNYTKYWARFRVVTDITQDATVNLIQLHPNRTKINDDGMIEMFGRARQPFFLRYGLHGVISNVDSTPSNQNVSYGAGVTAAYKYNKFANNAKDGFLITQSIPEELDTSIKLQFLVSFYVNGTGTGNVELSADVFYIEDGFSYDGTTVPTTIKKQIPITVASDKVRKTARIKIPVNNMSNLGAGGALLIHLYRDARVSNTNDTVENDIVLTFIQLSGYRWRA